MKEMVLGPSEKIKSLKTRLEMFFEVLEMDFNL